MPSGAIVPFPVERELEKNPDVSRADLDRLRAWLATQPHLPAEHITDLDLALVFHCCERSAEVSKQVLDLHYTLRTLFTALFSSRILDAKVENCLNVALLSPCPVPTAEGYRAIYCRLLDPDPRLFVFPDIVRTFMMTFDLWQLQEGTWPGLVILIDMDLCKMGHVTRLDPMTVRQVLYFLQEAMLVRLQSVHFLNAPPFMDRVMMLLKPFMKKRLLDMIRIHEAGSEAVYELVPRAGFPKENGGEHMDYNTIRDLTIQRFKDNAAYFQEEMKKRVNESLRPGGKKTTVEDLFGIQGSFKKLDID